MCPQGAVFLQYSLESVVSSEKLEQFHIFPFPGIICYDRRSGRGFFLKYGFGRTAVQMACTLLALCLGIGLLRQERMRTVFSEERVTLPIIMYHSILKDGARQGKYVVSPEVLARDLDALRARGCETVTVRDLIAYTRDGAPLPAKPVMLTFDDGYYNNYVYAYPLLRQRGMRAVVSIIGSQTALFTENGEENAYWSHLRAERLRETEDVFEIQNHSWNLHEYGERRGCLRRSGEDEARYAKLLHEDTEQTQQLIEEIGLPTPECYTYPFGACSEESERILRKMGFLCTLGCEERINTGDARPGVASISSAASTAPPSSRTDELSAPRTGGVKMEVCGFPSCTAARSSTCATGRAWERYAIWSLTRPAARSAPIVVPGPRAG